jgi:hypothetical protein
MSTFSASFLFILTLPRLSLDVYCRLFVQDFSLDIGLPQVTNTCVLKLPTLIKPDPQRKEAVASMLNV